MEVQLFNIDTIHSIARSLPGTEAGEHSGRLAFRVRNKIFATVWTDEQRIVLNLSIEDQTAFIAMNSQAFVPVQGAWGDKGWTSVYLDHVEPDALEEALFVAWSQCAPKKVVQAYIADKT